MESYNKLSDIELLHQINLVKKSHEIFKKDSIDLTIEIERLEKIVNEKLEELENIEKNYVDLMQEMTSRQ
jgi:archaellum component FlaC